MKPRITIPLKDLIVGTLISLPFWCLILIWLNEGR